MPLIDTNISKESTQLDLKALVELQNATLQSVKELNEIMIYFTNVLMAQQPRLDANQRAAVNVETGSVTVGTITTLTNLTALNGLAGGQSTAHMAHNLADSGLTPIYDNIRIT